MQRRVLVRPILPCMLESYAVDLTLAALARPTVLNCP